MDIALLNIDKKKRDTWKKTKIYHAKTFITIIVQENHFQITIIPLDDNQFTEITTTEDLQINEIHEISHKTDIVDQTVKTINTELVIQDQTKQK